MYHRTIFLLRQLPWVVVISLLTSNANAYEFYYGAALGYLPSVDLEPEEIETYEIDIDRIIIPPERHLFEKAHNKIKSAKVLTIADADNVVKFGVMIGLLINEDKVGFQINHTVAKSSGLEISSKLLKLAKEVI